MSTVIKGSAPFNTIPGAATNDARDHESALRELHAQAPEEWRAVRLGRYWDGAVSIALMKPDSLSVRELTVTANGQLAAVRRGPGIVPVLLAHDATVIEVATSSDRFELPVVDL